MLIKPHFIAATFVVALSTRASAQDFLPPTLAPGQPVSAAAVVDGPPPVTLTAAQDNVEFTPAPPGGVAGPGIPGGPVMPGPGCGCGPAGGVAPAAPFAPGPWNPMPPMGNGFHVFQPAAPAFYFTGEAVWLLRDRPNNRDLTFQVNGPPASNSKTILSTDDLGFHFEPGMRLTLGLMVTRDTAIEGGFYGLQDWDARQSTPDVHNNSLFPYWSIGSVPITTSGFLGSDRQVASSSSSFDSAEIGMRHWFNPNMSMLLGFRYINVSDQFQLAAYNDTFGPGATGVYRTSTDNNLYGAQLGFQYKHNVFSNWLSASLEARSGAFANTADQKNQLFSAAVPFSGSVNGNPLASAGATNDQREARETTFAGMGELTFALTAQVTNYLTLRGGYTFLFIDGIALAPDQLDTTPTTANARNSIADKGSMTLQGPFIGGEVAW